ncbi:high-potential iron-sulfur protein [Sphingomonas sp. RT2P30]|uniref:high-potential iron-sulfur protein n=1 Tax=Parasphingomonas halimpatiens TaxID=3096162 RepID=UPI002FC7D996
MTTDRTFMSADLSRRAVLHLAVAGGGVLVAATVPAAAVAGSKIAQKAVKYQPTPKGKAQCDNCRQWQAPAACKLVDGVISPSGWCSIYAPK